MKKKASRRKHTTKSKKAVGKTQRKGKQPADPHVSDCSVSEDSHESTSSDSDPEADVEEEGEEVLPFSMVRVEHPGAPVKRQAVGAPKPKSQYEPSPRPQFQRPQT